MSLLLLTESRMRCFRRCQREEKLRYQDGLVTLRSAALEFGTLIHGALERWWLLDLAAVETWLAEQKADAFDVAKAWALMRGYEAMYAGDRDRYEVEIVEGEFRAPLVNPLTGAASKTWQLAGKVDVIVRDRETGRAFLVEHKTSSEDITPGAGYWVRLRMDGQISCYFVGAAALGHPVEGCIYDVIGKPALRPYQVSSKRAVAETAEEYGERIFAAIAESPERYYQRSTVVRLESELIEWQLDTWQQAAAMRDAKRMGVATRNPESCVRYGSACGYLPLCAGEANANSYQRVEWVHPELTKEVSDGNAPSSKETRTASAA